MQRDFSSLVRSGGLNSVAMKMHWKEYARGAEHDPNFESSGDATFVLRELEVRGNVHVIDYASTGYSRFAGVESGNLIVDFEVTVDFAGKDDIYFEWQGKEYAQKNVGRDVAESLDVQCGEVVLCKTLLLAARV